MKSGASPARMGALETVRLLNLSLYITNSPLCHLICSIDIFTAVSSDNLHLAHISDETGKKH